MNAAILKRMAEREAEIMDIRESPARSAALRRAETELHPRAAFGKEKATLKSLAMFGICTSQKPPERELKAP